jgi:hypothetical protein
MRIGMKRSAVLLALASAATGAVAPACGGRVDKPKDVIATADAYGVPVFIDSSAPADAAPDTYGPAQAYGIAFPPDSGTPDEGIDVVAPVADYGIAGGDDAGDE